MRVPGRCSCAVIARSSLMGNYVTCSPHTDYHTIYHPDAAPNTLSPSRLLSTIADFTRGTSAENQHQLDGKDGAATRTNTRRQPPPYSAVCSFQQGTGLRCMDGSHLVISNEYKKENGVDCPHRWHGGCCGTGYSSMQAPHALARGTRDSTCAFASWVVRMPLLARLT